MTVLLDKPPYQIPPTREILDTPSNGKTVISTFTGTGGSSLGFRWAGFDVLVATEFVEEARKTYTANFGSDSVIIPHDVRDVSGADLVTAAKARFKTLHPGRRWPGVDVLEGSPPCSAFSLSGNRSKGWGDARKSYSDTSQTNVEDLFFEFVRLVDEIKPKVFLSENVPGLTMGASLGYYFDILEAFKAVGYRVETKIVDASWLGVPQTRKRLFFMGVRNDLEKDPVWPVPRPHRYSLKEAFVGLEDPDPDSEEYARWFDDPTKSVYQMWKSFEFHETGGKSHFNLRRCDPNRPCATLTAAGSGWASASPAHWLEPRHFHIPEQRRICGFPDDWILTGAYAKRGERLARAVPPPVSKALAESILEVIG